LLKYRKTMKQFPFLLLAIIVISFTSKAQQTSTSAVEYFTEYGTSYTGPKIPPAWVPTSQESLTMYKSQLIVNCTNDGANYLGLKFNFSPCLNLSEYPYLSVNIKSGTAFTLRIDLLDSLNMDSNQNPITASIPGDGAYHTYYFDFTGKLNQQYGGPVGPLNASKIRSAMFITNPGSGYSSNYLIDSVLVGSKAKTIAANFPRAIKLNQVGFYTNGYKKAVVNGATETGFYIVKSSAQTDTVFKGILGSVNKWTYSGELVQIADFTKFTLPGTYIIQVPGVPDSYVFSISDVALNGAEVSTIRGYYYQRASIPLISKYAGTWSRAEGHPDNNVLIHPSAATSLRPAGTSISSPRGWYDAGDYNKYVVNAGISTYTLLSAYEHYSSYYDTLFLNIPESGNGVPDILDEALWEIRWLLTMQDPNDGGVYHKLTNLNFDPLTTMPADATTTRYVVSKSTQATYDFAAIMAQSARIFSSFPTQLPGLADSCINAAVFAYNWAQANQNVFYNQTTLNNDYPTLQVNTGTYSDSYSKDEQYWASAELFTTTQNYSYYPAFSTLSSINPGIPSWPNVSTLGLLTLSHYRKLLPAISSDTVNIKNVITNMALPYKTYATNTATSAYAMAMGATSDFIWGSNGQAGNEAFVLLEAFNYANDSTYLYSALSNVDYMLGRNGPGYCWVTDLGSNSPMNISHRVSIADGIVAPVPGLLAAGANANPDPAENCALPYPYPSSIPGFSYFDNTCSYSTNEIAINWNAPLVYSLGAIQSIYSGITSSANQYQPVINTTTGVLNKVVNKIDITVFPNPANSKLYVVKPFQLNSNPVICDLNGTQYNVTGDWSTDQIYINTGELAPGMYLITLQGDAGFAVQKFTIMR